MKILVIAPDYPDDVRSVFFFVKQLVDELASLGHSIQVIAPYSLTHNRRFIKSKTTYFIRNSKVIVYRPKFISISNIRIGKQGLSDLIKKRAYRRGFSMLEEAPDIVYGHFWHSAFMGYNYAKSKRLPLFVATGESEIDFRNDCDEIKAFCDYVSGVICVSTKNKEESVRLGLTENSKCVVIPNAIDSNLFKKIGKKECRQELELPQDAFIVSFVGWFNERKGSERLSEAISKLKGTEKVYSIFIGEGQKNPNCANILFKGRLSHDVIPKYLNSADIFVLPTLQEGCCNAVIEAMACGLPIVSSNLPFNWDVLDNTNSIMVDPNNIDEIANAIELLHNNSDLLGVLSKGALSTAASLTITKRAHRIIDFINEKTRNNL
jgi:glycosyltransferase involved in cell wall biosynthesis